MNGVLPHCHLQVAVQVACVQYNTHSFERNLSVNNSNPNKSKRKRKNTKSCVSRLYKANHSLCNQDFHPASSAGTFLCEARYA